MSRSAGDIFAAPVSIASEHGLLHGQLDFVHGASGLVVLAHAAEALDRRENLLAEHFRQGGLSTLSVDLISRREERYADVHHNVPLLAKRLLEFLGLIKNRMQLGELEKQPFGLCAAQSTSPVAVRVAALRDHDIAAIVCQGGLIDLAGMLYLRALESPLLLLVEATDAPCIASGERALRAMHGAHELRLIPEIGINYAVSSGFSVAAANAAQWFLKHFKPLRGAPS
jgi:putative phosphoribosyl transferase